MSALLKFPTKCSVDGCDRSAKHGAFCHKHYSYNRRHGIPEPVDNKVQPLSIADKDAAWLAAVIDCEGWIGTLGSSRRGSKGYANRIGVGNTNPKLIDRLIELTGMGRVRFVKAPNERCKDQLHWQIDKRDDIRIFLLTILPHLLLKKEQAELILSLPPRNSKNNEFRAIVHLRLKELNKKGPK